MRYSAMLGMLFGVAAAAVGAAMPPMASDGYGQRSGPLLIRERRGKGENNRRGKGRVDRPKKRRNMVRLSKRVRRKHRRQAA